MADIQLIEHHGRVAGVVITGQEAIVSDILQGDDRRIVLAKCLYALKISDGERPGPYRDQDATLYALNVLARAGVEHRDGGAPTRPRSPPRRLPA